MKLIGLFNSQKEAGNAVESLSTDDFSGVETHVIEEAPAEGSPNKELERGSYVIAPNPTTIDSRTAVPPVGPMTGAPAPLVELSLSKPQERFVKNGLRDGGVAVIVDPSDIAIADIKQVLRENDGTVFEE